MKSLKTLAAKFNPRWIIGVCLSLWLIFLLIIATPNLTGGSMLRLQILPIAGSWALLFSLLSLVVLVLGLQNPKNKKDAINARPANAIIVRTLAALIVAGLLVSTYCSIHFLSIFPSHLGYAAFAYENTGLGTTFGALVLIFVLNALQRDIYWISRNRAMQLDEFQLRERQRIFEVSYMIGAWLVALSAIALFLHKRNLIHVLVENAGLQNFPSAVFVLIFNVVLMLFALPLVLAAFRKSYKI